MLLGGAQTIDRKAIGRKTIWSKAIGRKLLVEKTIGRKDYWSKKTNWSKFF